MNLGANKIGIAALCAFVFLLAFFFSWQASRQSAETHVIRVAYLPVMQSLPLFVAIEQGKFANAGLNVQVERIESPNQIIDALVTDKVDAGAPSVAAGITAIVDAREPGSLKIYSLSCTPKNELSNELLIPGNSNITSIKDLKGKRLGYIPGVQFSTMADKILIGNGILPSEVTMLELPVPNQLQSLASGEVDAILTLEPTGTIGSLKNVSRVLVANPMDEYVSTPWCGGAGVVSAKFLEDDPKDAEAFIDIMREAELETGRNATTREYLVKYLGIPESAAMLAPLPIFVSTQNISPAMVSAYQKFVDTFYELNVTEKQEDVKSILLD